MTDTVDLATLGFSADTSDLLAANAALAQLEKRAASVEAALSRPAATSSRYPNVSYPSRTKRRRRSSRLSPSDRMLAVMAGQSHQLVQDATSILTARPLIAASQNRQNLIARRHADHPHRTPP